MSDLLPNLKKLSEEYRKSLYDLQDKIKTIEETPLAEALLGKCFKYRNSYGSGKGWWLYKRVTKLFQKTGLCIDTFQEDEHGKIEFEYDNHAYVYQFNRDIPISLKEYLAAEKKLLDKMLKRNKRNKK